MSSPDGWVTPPLGSERGVPAFSAYNQFSTPAGKPGWIKIVVSRAGWQGKDKPGNVEIKVGDLVRGADKQPALGKVRAGAALEGARRQDAGLLRPARRRPPGSR